MRLGNISTRLKTLQAKAPYRGIVKLPAEPVLLFHRAQHVLNKNFITSCRIVDQNMGHSADEVAVLNNGAAEHE